jgi:thiol-disulfide isomerase/thioredoxin
MKINLLRSVAAFPLLVLLCLLAACNNNNRFSVTGQFANLPQQTIKLRELRYDDKIIMLDSVQSDAQGHFELRGESREPGFFQVIFAEGDYINLSLNKESVKLSGDYRDIHNYQVAGSPASASMRNFGRALSGYINDIRTYDMVMGELRKQGRDSMIPQALADLNKTTAGLTQYIESYVDTTRYLPNALFAVRILNHESEEQFISTFVQSLPRRFNNDPQAVGFTKFWNEAMAAKKAAQGGQGQQFTGGPVMGAVAPAISGQTPEGKTLSLESLRGKYVLVDFWASWCGPCRAENPNVVAAFNKFKGKSFTVFGVSLDDNKDKWVNAIQSDGLAWPQVSDLKGWESIPARAYGVESIPSNFLLDKEGRIIARDLRGPALEEKLAELLK